MNPIFHRSFDKTSSTRMIMFFFQAVAFICCVLLTNVPMNSSAESTLRLYDSFAEIHQDYHGPIRFPQNDWNNIKHESIMLRSSSNDDMNETTNVFERRIVRISMNMTGKKILARRYAEQKYPIVCEIIHEESTHSLVREVETGNYFRAPTNLIEYFDEPQSTSFYEVSFSPMSSSGSFIVSYIVKTLRWQPRYMLQTYADIPTKLLIFIDIINSGPFTYQFNETHLMSGDIDLTFGTKKISSLIDAKTSAKTNLDFSGIHLFSSINNSITIDPYSILTLPMQSLNLQVKVIYTYNLILTMPTSPSNNVLSVTSNKFKFQRLYQLSNGSSFIPTGHLLIYDSSSNVLTGEWHLPTLAESEKYEFKLGEDADTVFEYNRTITNNQKTNSSLITTNVLIQNYKQRNINIRFKSACESSLVCLFYDDKARSLGARLNYDLYLKAKSEVAFSFTTIRLF